MRLSLTKSDSQYRVNILKYQYVPAKRLVHVALCRARGLTISDSCNLLKIRVYGHFAAAGPFVSLNNTDSVS